MDFELSDEQSQLRDVVRLLLDREATSTAVRAAASSTEGYDPKLWRLLGEQIGAHAFAIPEESGGAGFTLFEQGIVLEELGRHLTPSPYLGSSVLAVHALLGLDDPTRTGPLLSALASGKTIATIGWAGPEGRWQPDGTHVESDADRLNGSVHYVLDATAAETMLVPAHTPRGLQLYAVDAASSGVEIVPLTSMDQTRRIATVVLNGAYGLSLGDFTTGMRRLRDVCLAASAVEAVGGASGCFDDTVAYVKARSQFGRPIGSFQAVKHRLADLHVRVEAGKSIAYAALWAVAMSDVSAHRLALTAKAYCSDMYEAVAADSIQLHGGNGISWEFDAHLHFKRAHSSAQLFGSRRQIHRELAVDYGFVPAA